ncbi:hypothetical protein M3182_01480 [Mesobacillus maritimus]|uniref:hypothetical protein n=1 Tax=Mesobacillus maritimus TaxID=1643336 RepID=UPI0020413CA5|nr:hypothetical protein [Mesobacillus maritimus]MCM3584411.1 hypothetical protein [Mesobacillus maritimus]MCM3670856.1 hypothetical protein [Mesobacillus maritimus]
MKRMLSLAIMFILFSFLSACSADEKKIVIMEDLNNPSREEIRAKTQHQPNSDKKISKEIGIGATREQFEQAYGENYGDQEIARYQNEFMIVTYESHRAVNVQYQFAYKPGDNPTMDELEAFITDRIPSDAVELKRVNKDTTQEVIHYHSNALKKHIAKHSFREGEPGNFVVILNKNDQGDLSVTIAVGGHN